MIKGISCFDTNRRKPSWASLPPKLAEGRACVPQLRPLRGAEDASLLRQNLKVSAMVKSITTVHGLEEPEKHCTIHTLVEDYSDEECIYQSP